jgi:predicted GIY-YIG superfamily endonuclease
MNGTVYLIKLDKKLKQSEYYIGWCKKDPLERLKTHRSGRGSRFLAACNVNGIDYHIVRTWKNKDRNFERKLKNRHNHKNLCPIYNPKLWRFKAHKLILK